MVSVFLLHIHWIIHHCFGALSPEMILKDTMFLEKKQTYATTKCEMFLFFNWPQSHSVTVTSTWLLQRGNSGWVLCSGKRNWQYLGVGSQQEFSSLFLQLWLVLVGWGTCTEWDGIYILWCPDEANCWQVERSDWWNCASWRARLST